jgi:hypothetical protein
MIFSVKIELNFLYLFKIIPKKWLLYQELTLTFYSLLCGFVSFLDNIFLDHIA